TESNNNNRHWRAPGSSFGKRWHGFEQSTDKDSAGRYYAKCIYCSNEMPEELRPAYNLPSRNVLVESILVNHYTDYLTRLFDKLNNSMNITLCMDGWEDVSKNSIYGFMALKNEEEYVLDILDLSKEHHTANNLQVALEEAIKRSMLKYDSIIALVTDNPSTMIKYSLAKMCLGISAYEDGFKHCAIESFRSDAPTIPENVQIIINDKFHFAYNYELQQVLLPIVNAIGTLEACTSTLADIFIQLINCRNAIINLKNIDTSLQNYALNAINKQARYFDDQSGIYFVALFLIPQYRQIA
ncbi:24850_t:CDS:2, partial [Gigaspora rosea]